MVAVFWTGFFILDGYDFGVGALHRRIGRDKEERHEVVETIGPYWDANEVWLVVAVAAVFAAFPDWYATWLSAGYLAFVLALALLLVRGTAIEYGSRGEGVAWDRAWGWGLVVSSLLIPFVLGLALGDLLAGLPLDDSGAFTGGIADIVTPFGVLLGVAMAVLCVVQGGAFLLLRTTGDVWARARRETSRVAVIAPLVVAAAAAWMFATDRIGLEARAVAIVAVAASVTAAFYVLRGRGGLAFVASTAAVAATVASVFVGLYPDVVVSSTSAESLSVTDAASGHYALQVMSWVALALVPIVLGYQAWSYVLLRRRVLGVAS